MIRSEVRHSLFRMKNGVPKDTATEIYDIVRPLIPDGESWESFSVGWDIIVHKGKIAVIRPETNYEFVHSTCLEMSLCIKNKVDPDFDTRQQNIIAIVESTMLEGKMSWENYNKKWGLTLDPERKFIQTQLFATNVNEVTEEMIKNSAKSDGAAMTQVPSIPENKIDLAPFEPSETQKAAIDSMIRSRKKK